MTSGVAAAQVSSVNTPARPASLMIAAGLVLVQILFGMNYVVSKIVVGVFQPLVWASLRLILSTLLLGFLLKFVLRRPHPAKTREFFLPMIGLSLLGVIINQASFLVGLKLTTSTNSAVLNTLIPVFTLMVVTIRGQELLTTKRVVGLLCALSGVLVLRKIENFTISDQTFVGDLLTMLNCLSYALFLSFGKRFMSKFDPIWVTFWLFTYGSVGMTLLAVPQWLQFTMPVFTGHLIAACLFAVFGATLLTYFLNFWALAYAKPSQVALYGYLQPIVAASFAWLVFSEPLTLRMVFSSALIFVGMLMGLSGRQVKPGSSPSNLATRSEQS